MSGPKTARAAIDWVQRAVEAGDFTVAAHFNDQAKDRGLGLVDAEYAIASATRCVPSRDHPPRHGGTSWRIYGPGIDVECIVVACEAYRNVLSEWCILITIVDEDEER